jgi:hypothetical protein
MVIYFPSKSQIVTVGAAEFFYLAATRILHAGALINWVTIASLRTNTGKTKWTKGYIQNAY